MARAQLVFLLGCALVVLVLATSMAAGAEAKVPKPKPKPKPKLVRCSVRKFFPTCTNYMYCPARCPKSCYVDCAACKPICVCNLPGAVCYDPQFIGGDGITFYFHGRKDRNFCLLSDSDLHINAHFIGKRDPSMTRDFTWVDAIAVLFEGHRLSVRAQKTAKWDDEADHLEITFEGELVQLPSGEGARWESPTASTTTTAPAVSVVRTAGANAVVVEVEGRVTITANAVPITEEDSRVHNYGLTPDDCLGHLELAFKFHALTGGVQGVLGQTYREDYVSRVDVTKKMPVMGGADKFLTSDLFAADCSVSQLAGVGAIALPSEAVSNE